MEGRSAMETVSKLNQSIESSIKLFKRLNGARWVRFDERRRQVFVWSGGHGVEVFNLQGEPVSFWNVGDFEKIDADLEDVKESIEEAIETGDLP